MDNKKIGPSEKVSDLAVLTPSLDELIEKVLSKVNSEQDKTQEHRIFDLRGGNCLPFYSIAEVRLASDRNNAIDALLSYVESQHWEDAKTGNIKVFNLFLRCKSLGFTLDESVNVAEIIFKYYMLKHSKSDLKRQCRNAFHIDEAEGKSCSEGTDSSIVSFQPKFDPERLRQTVSKVPSICAGAFQWFSTSIPKDVKEYLEGLFDEDEFVFITERLNAKVPTYLKDHFHKSPTSFSSYDGGFFLCNPVTGKVEAKDTLTNGYSYRSEGCITNFKYMLLECDIEGFERQWLQFLFQLEMPIVSIVFSGGKSYHALVKVNAKTKDEWLDFRNRHIDYLVSHGADKAALTAVRLTRLPFCVRESTGQTQHLYYYNPQADGRSIQQLAEERKAC